MRRVLRAPRALTTGAVLPVLLLLLADPAVREAPTRVAGLAVLGTGMTAWTTHGIGLVAARESGELRRWWASPTPRWCYLAARICASVLVAAAGGLVTLVLGVVGWDVPFGLPAAVAACGTLLLGAAAWASAATAITRIVSGVEAAWPVLGLVYLPVVLTSGAFGDVHWPWLRAVGATFPARPMADSLRAVLGAGRADAVDILVLAAWTVGGLAISVATFRWDPTAPRDAA